MAAHFRQQIMILSLLKHHNRLNKLLYLYFVCNLLSSQLALY